jgi:hydrogenase nickel incorporation protein HypA/HybF
MNSIMHEMGIMESALALVRCHAEQNKARQVSRIVLRIGALAGVEPESLRFAFDVMSRGTTAEGAIFDIESVPVAVYCVFCNQEFSVATGGFIFTCPTCGDLCGEIRRGRELELSRIEMS